MKRELTKSEKVHAKRSMDRPYFFKFTYTNGMTKVIGSETTRPPLNVAGRLGSQNGWGVVVTHHRLPDEAAEAHRRQLQEYTKEVKDPEKYKDINTEDDLSSGSLPILPAEIEDYIKTHPESLEQVKMRNTVEACDRIEQWKMLDEDENLLNLLVSGQTLSKKAVDRFSRLFSMFSDADPDDPDEVDLMIYFTSMIQKGVSEIDDVLETIRRNLEGSFEKEQK